VAFLTTGPVLRTLAGCHERVAGLDCYDCMILTNRLNCRYGRLFRRLYDGDKAQRRAQYDAHD